MQRKSEILIFVWKLPMTNWWQFLENILKPTLKLAVLQADVYSLAISNLGSKGLPYSLHGFHLCLSFLLMSCSQKNITGIKLHACIRKLYWHSSTNTNSQENRLQMRFCGLFVLLFFFLRLTFMLRSGFGFKNLTFSILKHLVLLCTFKFNFKNLHCAFISQQKTLRGLYYRIPVKNYIPFNILYCIYNILDFLFKYCFAIVSYNKYS